LRQGLRRAVALCLAGVLLTAQLMVGAYACPALSVPAHTAPVAQASFYATDQAASDMPAAKPIDCGDMVGMTDASSPNLCAEHCKQGQQADHAAVPGVPAAVLTLLYTTPSVPHTAPPPRPTAAALSALVAASPPHAIAHCVFRI
jgi:hypothetical protein